MPMDLCRNSTYVRQGLHLGACPGHAALPKRQVGDMGIKGRCFLVKALDADPGARRAPLALSFSNSSASNPTGPDAFHQMLQLF